MNRAEMYYDDWNWLEAAVRKLSPDYLADGRDQPEPQQRPALEQLFPAP